MTNIRSFEQYTPQLGHDVYIDDSAIVIGDVIIGDDCGIWPSTVIRGDINAIRIGHSTNIQDASVLHINHDSRFYPGGSQLIIGNGVTVGHKVLLHGCQIADYCLVGMGSIIMDDATLAKETMLGAGSIVPQGKQLEGGYLWMGAPAKKVRELTDKEREFLYYSAEHYVKLKNRHRNDN